MKDDQHGAPNGPPDGAESAKSFRSRRLQAQPKQKRGAVLGLVSISILVAVLAVNLAEKTGSKESARSEESSAASEPMEDSEPVQDEAEAPTAPLPFKFSDVVSTLKGGKSKRSEREDPRHPYLEWSKEWPDNYYLLRITGFGDETNISRLQILFTIPHDFQSDEQMEIEEFADIRTAIMAAFGTDGMKARSFLGKRVKRTRNGMHELSSNAEDIGALHVSFESAGGNNLMFSMDVISAN